MVELKKQLLQQRRVRPLSSPRDDRGDVFKLPSASDDHDESRDHDDAGQLLPPSH